MYNALQSLQAFEMGQAGRKEREREAAMKTFGNALSMNDYEGASKIGFGIDPALGMQARQYGESQNALALNKQIAPLMAAGKYDEASTLAAPSGNLDLLAQLEQFKQNATLQQRQDAAYKAEEFAKVAAGYKGISAEQAAAKWQQDQVLLQQRGIDPAALAQFDPMDPKDIEDAIFSAQSLADIQAGQRYDAEREYAEEQDTQAQRNWQAEFDAREAEAKANGGAGSYGLNIVWGTDANGNAVAMQPSKGGGLQVAQTPDGVSLLDPYATALDRKLGAVAAETEAGRNPAEQGVLAAEADMTRLGEQIDLAITQSDKGNTGPVGQYNVFATDLAGTLKTIRASGAFTSLVNLKAQGGTLGALSDAELQLLEAKIANVERSQTEEQLDRNLMELKNALTQSSKRIRAAYEKEYAAGRYGRGGAASQPAAGLRPVGPSGQPVPEGFE